MSRHARCLVSRELNAYIVVNICRFRGEENDPTNPKQDRHGFHERRKVRQVWMPKIPTISQRFKWQLCSLWHFHNPVGCNVMMRRFWDSYQVTPIPTPERTVTLWSGDWDAEGNPINEHTFTSTRAMMKWIRSQHKNRHKLFKTVRDPCGAWLEVRSCYNPRWCE